MTSEPQTRTKIREQLKALLRNEFDNVEDVFIFPTQKAELEANFPYITVVLGKMPLEGGTRRGSLEVSVIGITKGEDKYLPELADQMEGKIFKSLHKNGKIAITITEIDPSNLFKPFGLDAGIFPPYAGVRFSCTIPEVKVI